jgi:hypothetical protein
VALFKTRQVRANYLAMGMPIPFTVEMPLFVEKSENLLSQHLQSAIMVQAI